MEGVSLDKNDETSGRSMPSLETNTSLESQEKEKSDTHKRIHSSLKSNATGGDVQPNSLLAQITTHEEDALPSPKRRKITSLRRQHSSVGNNGPDHGLQEAIFSTKTCLEKDLLKKDGSLRTYQRRHKIDSRPIQDSPQPFEEHRGSLMHIVRNSLMGETSANLSDEVLTSRPSGINFSGSMGCGISGSGQPGEPEGQTEVPADCLSVEPEVENGNDGMERMHIVWKSSMGESSVNLSDEVLTSGPSRIKFSGGMGCGISGSGQVEELEVQMEVPANFLSVEPAAKNRNEGTEMMHAVRSSSMGETSANLSDEVLTFGPSRIKSGEGTGCGILVSGQAEELEGHMEVPTSCLSVEPAVENRNEGTEMMHIVRNSSMGETSMNLSDEVLTLGSSGIKLSEDMGRRISGSEQVGKLEGWTEVPANCLSVEPAVENRNEGTEMMLIFWNSSMGETSLNHSGEVLTIGSSEINLTGDMGRGISGSGQVGELEGQNEVPANCLSVKCASENKNDGTEMMHIVQNSSMGETSMNLSDEVLTYGSSGIKSSGDMGCGISGSEQVGKLKGCTEVPANCLSVELLVENRKEGTEMMHILQDSSMGGTSLTHSGEVLTSGSSGIKLSGDMRRDISGLGQVGELEGQNEVPANCLSVKCATENRNERKGMNLEEAVKENIIPKDVSASDLPQQYSEKASCVKVDQVQNVIGDSTSRTEHIKVFTTFDKNKYSDGLSSSDAVCKHPKQDNVDIESRSEICSSSNLDLLEDDNQVIVVQKDNSPQMSHPSSEVHLSGVPRKKLLILDVNGLLADIVSNLFDDYSTDTTIGKKAVFKRPFFDDFMQFCFENFNVGIWTSRTRRNVDMVLDVLMGDSKKQLLFIWDQWQCTDTGRFTIENTKPLFLKELKKLWEKKDPNLPWEKGEYDESNTLLLDDSPYKALGNPPYTAIFPETYSFKDTEDGSLGSGGYLRVYLEGLAKAENVQKYVELNPIGQPAITKESADWRFYESVLQAVTSRPHGDSCRSHGNGSRGDSYRPRGDIYKPRRGSYRFGRDSYRYQGGSYRPWRDSYRHEGDTYRSQGNGYRPRSDTQDVLQL